VFLRRAGLLSAWHGATTFIRSLTGVLGFFMTITGCDIFVKVPETFPDTGRQVRFRFVSAVRRVHGRFSIPFLIQGGKSRSGEQRESERKYTGRELFCPGNLVVVPVSSPDRYCGFCASFSSFSNRPSLPNLYLRFPAIHSPYTGFDSQSLPDLSHRDFNHPAAVIGRIQEIALLPEWI